MAKKKKTKKSSVINRVRDELEFHGAHHLAVLGGDFGRYVIHRNGAIVAELQRNKRYGITVTLHNARGIRRFGPNDIASACECIAGNVPS